MIEKLDETIDYVDDEQDVNDCFPLIRQLRPHLSSPEEFLARWRRQIGDGYRLVALRRNGTTMALAGFRVQENLVHGRFLYVDDLVTDDAHRSAGLGERLMVHLMAIGQKLACTKLVLDTPLTNVLGHRFYYRQGLLATALRFNIPLA